MRNYLARLGWSHGDEEVFTTAQFIEWFNLEAIGRSPARFDTEKLTNINAQHLNMSRDATLVGEAMALNPALANFEVQLTAAMPLFEGARATLCPTCAPMPLFGGAAADCG